MTFALWVALFLSQVGTAADDTPPPPPPPPFSTPEQNVPAQEKPTQSSPQNPVELPSASEAPPPNAPDIQPPSAPSSQSGDEPKAGSQSPLSPPPLQAAEPVAPSAGFVKGELSVYLGADRLTVKRNRIGVSLGVDYVFNILFAVVEPQVDLRFLDAKLGIGVGVPLRFEVFNFNDADGKVIANSRMGRLRVEDYDTVHDFGRVLKYVSYGKKEDNFYVNVGQRYATSIGHGAIMRRYSPNIDVNYPRVSAEVDAYNDYAGFELFTNDILEWNVMGGLAFIKPLSFFKPQNLLARTFSIGVTGAVDRDAPSSLTYDPQYGTRQLTSDGSRIVAQSAPLGLIGIDAEIKVIKTDSIDLKPYVDYSMIWGGGGGLTVGALARFNVGKSPIHAFRLVLEGRYLDDRYTPSYFDTFYEIDRYQARRIGRNSFGIYDMQTKQQMVNAGLGTRAGLYAEASWGIPHVLGFTVAFEANSKDDAKNMVAHLELPWLNFFQLFGSFYKRGFKDFSEFAKADENTVLFAGARLRTLPFLFINARAYKSFRVNSDIQAYDNQFGFVVDLELGFEFGKSREEYEGQREAEQKMEKPGASSASAK